MRLAEVEALLGERTALVLLSHVAYKSAYIADLPGITATPAEMLDSLERLVGAEARARVALTRDARVEAIVCSWPGAFDVTRACALGFDADTDFDAILTQFLADR